MIPINKSILRAIPSMRQNDRQRLPSGKEAVLNTPKYKSEMSFPEDQTELREAVKKGDLSSIKSFNEAFGTARKMGLTEFTWTNPKTGKRMRYGTKLAGEADSSAPTQTTAKPTPAVAKKKSVIEQPQSLYYSQYDSKKTDSPILNQILQDPRYKKPANVAKFTNKTALYPPKQKFTEEELALIEKETPKIKEGINGPRNSYKAELLERANPKAPEKSIVGGRSKYVAMYSGIGVEPGTYKEVADVIAGRKKYADVSSRAIMYFNSLVDRSVGPEPDSDAIGEPEWRTIQTGEHGAAIKQEKNPKYIPEKIVEQKNTIYKRNRRIKAIDSMYGTEYYGSRYRK